MRLHHIGKVVKDIGIAVDYYKDTFGLRSLCAPVIDPIQKVEVVFLETGLKDDFTIELIRPVSKDSPVSKFLEQGGGLHHICFEVKDIYKTIEGLREKGGLLLGDPAPGKGHDNRLTAWLYTSQKELIELVESIS